MEHRKVAICLYLYHTDLWPIFKKYLLQISHHIKLYVTFCEDNAIISDLDDFDHEIFVCKNYGVDISPFMHQLHKIEEPIFVKLHSKKSLWGTMDWLQMILYDLMGTEDIFLRNIALFDKSRTGIVATPLFIKHSLEKTNSQKIEEICKILQINYPSVKNSNFVVGTMFMAQTNFFQNKINEDCVQIIDKLLSVEKKKVCDIKQGTYSHAMERIFGYLISFCGLNFEYANNDTFILKNKNSYLTLFKGYKNFCYSLNMPNISGHFVDRKEFVEISWKMAGFVRQKYKKNGQELQVILPKMNRLVPG